MGGQRFHLVHGYPGEGHETRIWGRVEPDNRSPFPDTICIVGHTPTVFLTDGHDEDFSIWHGDGILDIDCGCGGMKAAHRRLACLRLDDMAEFYVGGWEKAPLDLPGLPYLQEAFSLLVRLTIPSSSFHPDATHPHGHPACGPERYASPGVSAGASGRCADQCWIEAGSSPQSSGSCGRAGG